jgi:carbohydrate diacid regulator
MSDRSPQISPRLREKLLLLARDPSFVVDRTYSVLMDLDEDYAALAPTARRDVLDSIRIFVSIWFLCIVEGRPPAPNELELLAEAGRRRVHQDIGLNSLLRAFRAGSKEILNAYVELGREDEALRDELFFVVTPYLLEHSDAMAQAIAQAYLDEQFQGARWRDAMRYELYSAIFSAADDFQSFQKAAEALGVDPNGLRVGLAIYIDVSDISPPNLERELDRFTLSLARHLKVQHAELVRVMRHERLLVWVPCARGDSVITTDRAMFRLMSAAVQTLRPVCSVGIGLMNQGPNGWAATAREAIRALESGLAIEPPVRVRLFSQIAVNESVRYVDTTLRYLDSLIERLTHEPDLLPTLETYFRLSQRKKATAAALGIHPNTLTYRLDRIETLLGAKLTDFDSLINLYIAMNLRRGSAGGITNEVPGARRADQESLSTPKSPHSA